MDSSARLLELAQLDIANVLVQLESRIDGLTAGEVRQRFKQYGPNSFALQPQPCCSIASN